MNVPFFKLIFRRFFLGFICLSLLLFSFFVYAAEPIVGQIVWVKGVVKAISADKSVRELKRRSPVFAKDTIQTDATSTAEIVFSDSSLVTLRAATIFKIEQYKFNKENTNENEFVSSVAKGGFRTITGLISKAKPNSYHVKTPVATIGVRGTQYSIFYSEKKGLAVKLDVGSVLLTNQAGVQVLNQATNQIFATVTSVTQLPRVQNTIPAVFHSEPPLIPAKPSFVEPKASSETAPTSPTKDMQAPPATPKETESSPAVKDKETSPAGKDTETTVKENSVEPEKTSTKESAPQKTTTPKQDSSTDFCIS